MKVVHQRNVYFVDLSKSVYRGFVETTIQRQPGESVAVYKSKNLTILKVDVMASGAPRAADYISKDVVDIIDENQTSFRRDMWRKIDIDSTLEIHIPQDFKEDTLTIRILYDVGEDNDSVEFYRPVSPEDRHKEVVATNRAFDSSSIFPSHLSAHKNRWELVYILPSGEETRIISPGVLRSIREEESVTLYSYVVDNAHSGALNFCIGTFDAYEVTTGDDRKAVCIPKGLDGYKDCVREFCSDIENLIKYSEYFLQKEYPFQTLSIAFVFGDADRVYGQSTALLGLSNLTSSNDIEPMFLLKRVAGDILSSQMFYFYFSVVDRADFWISEGMKGYFEDYCTRHFLGNSEFLYGIKRDRDYVLDSDVTEYALYDPRRTLLSMREKFFVVKSKVFFHLLEANLSRAFMEKILNFAIKKRDDVREDYTFEFVKVVKDITGKDLRFLFEAYAFRPGGVQVRLGFTVNKKSNRVDFTTEQAGTSVFANRNKAVNGPMTICSHEMEGVFEHVFMLDRDNHFYYHPKTKKKKKSEEEEEVMPLLWIRADPKGEHLAKVVVEQPDYMFVEQLLDKNVIGQMEALESLSVKPSAQVCEILERVLENTHVFYKIRIHILYILSRTIVGNHYGFQRLIQYFVKKYCVQTSTIVKPNDFSFIPYFIQKHLVKALSLTDPFVFRSYSGRDVGSARIVCAFIVNILKFNDNSFNSYSDGWYISSVIEGLSFPLSAMSFSEFYSGKEGGELADKKGSEGKQPRAKDDISDLFGAAGYESFEDGMGGGKESGSDGGLHVSDVSMARSVDDARKRQLCFPCDDSRNSKKNSHRLLSGDTENREKEDGDSEQDQDYLRVSALEMERFRILDMVFPSHGNMVTRSCIYALGRLSLFGMTSLRKPMLVQLSKYPNFSDVRIAALEVLLVLFHDDDEVIGTVFEYICRETFTIKRRLLDIMRDLGTSSKFYFKDVLKGRREQLFGALRANRRNATIREKICTLIYLVEDMDLTHDDYYRAISRAYERTLSVGSHKAITRLGKEFVKDKHVTLRLRSMNALRKSLLKTDYILRVPTAHGTKKKRESLKHHTPRQVGSSGYGGSASTTLPLEAVGKTRRCKGLGHSEVELGDGVVVRVPGSFKIRLGRPGR